MAEKKLKVESVNASQSEVAKKTMISQFYSFGYKNGPIALNHQYLESEKESDSLKVFNVRSFSGPCKKLRDKGYTGKQKDVILDILRDPRNAKKLNELTIEINALATYIIAKLQRCFRM